MWLPLIPEAPLHAPLPLHTMVWSAFDRRLRCQAATVPQLRSLLPPSAQLTGSLSLQQGQIEVDSETVFTLAALVLQVRADPPPLLVPWFLWTACNSETLAWARGWWIFTPAGCLPVKNVSRCFCFRIVCMSCWEVVHLPGKGHLDCSGGRVETMLLERGSGWQECRRQQLLRGL